MNSKWQPMTLHPRVPTIEVDAPADNPTETDLKSMTFRAIHVALEELDKLNLSRPQRAKAIFDAVKAAQTL